MLRVSFFAILFLGSHAVACSGESSVPADTSCKAHEDCASSPGTPLCDAPTSACVALPQGHPIGWTDGSPGSVNFVIIHEPDKPREPTDLAFNPSKPTELWMVNRKDDSVIIIQNPGEPTMSWERRRDPAATHFMDRPPAIAFGAVSAEWGQTWGTCGDNDNGGDDFMGPALFSADLSVFAKPTPLGLGSHLDMLHSTTFCRGIAHVEANRFWAFNSNKQSLDLYDFTLDHGPGNDDHSDGTVLRYAKGAVLGVDDAPSHLFYNAEDHHLYIADTGHKRVAKLDTQSGTVAGNFTGLEPVASRKNVNDAVIVDVVPPGALEAPSGLEIHEGLLYVTDRTTSRFHAFDMTGKEVRKLDTGFPPGSLAGFTFGPDGRIYFVDTISGRIYRIEPHT